MGLHVLNIKYRRDTCMIRIKVRRKAAHIKCYMVHLCNLGISREGGGGRGEGGRWGVRWGGGGGGGGEEEYCGHAPESVLNICTTV